jgi:hypothetical protein
MSGFKEDIKLCFSTYREFLGQGISRNIGNL